MESKINEMINYQANAVVSKTLLEKKSGTITIFAFDKDQGLSEHSAPFDAVVQIIEGDAEIKISGEPHQLSEGEMIIMPANKPHALKAISRFKMILTMIKSQ
ncbi:cupin domain-containing protein [Desulfobacterium sp. N47]|uniref:Cupin type-2 domain-containing protein n=1 Tax=uncultured Desulfobacterium sp. TaxID=201089 RepID=E1YDJ6_9BACT|nr:hypothetical protein N47_G39640 [uncultured Desulfobacterium sp.]